VIRRWPKEEDKKNNPSRRIRSQGQNKEKVYTGGKVISLKPGRQEHHDRRGCGKV